MYVLVYSRGAGFPARTATPDKDRAVILAAQLRQQGYTVDVWQTVKDGLTKTDI